MVKTDSGSPAELVPGGIKIRWKFILSCVLTVLGGTTVAGLATTVGVGTSVAQEFTNFKNVQAAAHIDIADSLQAQDKKQLEQDGKIEVISKTIESVQTTQQRDVARTEARRLTEKINNRNDREDTYDRLYELNLKRLKRGADPCGSISCN